MINKATNYNSQSKVYHVYVERPPIYQNLVESEVTYNAILNTNLIFNQISHIYEELFLLSKLPSPNFSRKLFNITCHE